APSLLGKAPIAGVGPCSMAGDGAAPWSMPGIEPCSMAGACAQAPAAAARPRPAAMPANRFLSILKFAMFRSLHDNGAEHARFHVIQQMAVVGPVPPGVRAHAVADPLGRIQADRVLAHLEIAV